MVYSVWYHVIVLLLCEFVVENMFLILMLDWLIYCISTTIDGNHSCLEPSYFVQCPSYRPYQNFLTIPNLLTIPELSGHINVFQKKIRDNFRVYLECAHAHQAFLTTLVVLVLIDEIEKRHFFYFEAQDHCVLKWWSLVCLWLKHDWRGRILLCRCKTAIYGMK